jgi:hypothetical protein
MLSMRPDKDGDDTWYSVVDELRNSDCLRVQIPIGMSRSAAVRAMRKAADTLAAALDYAMKSSSAMGDAFADAFTDAIDGLDMSGLGDGSDEGSITDDPVLFLEHKHLYRQPYNRSENPGPDFTIPFGKARTVREGTDLSIITYGALVHRTEVAAAQLEREGISVEIVDLRSLSPYDWEAIAATVRKTHRVIVAYEDMLSWGYGAEIAARIADELFEELDAPVKRVAAMDTFCAYQPKLEDVILPQTSHIVAAVKQLLEY